MDQDYRALAAVPEILPEGGFEETSKLLKWMMKCFLSFLVSLLGASGVPVAAASTPEPKNPL